MHHRNIICGIKTHPHINYHGQYEFWRDMNYKVYIEQYGYHFNPHTLKVALEELENRDNSDHCWTMEQVIAAFEKMGKKIPKHFTPCDATYIANKMYAKFFGSSVKTEEMILEMTCDVMHDPNGYKGMVFLGWVDKLMFEACIIEWKNMI